MRLFGCQRFSPTPSSESTSEVRWGFWGVTDGHGCLGTWRVYFGSVLTPPPPSRHPLGSFLFVMFLRLDLYFRFLLLLSPRSSLHAAVQRRGTFPCLPFRRRTSLPPPPPSPGNTFNLSAVVQGIFFSGLVLLLICSSAQSPFCTDNGNSSLDRTCPFSRPNSLLFLSDFQTLG